MSGCQMLKLLGYPVGTLSGVAQSSSCLGDTREERCRGRASLLGSRPPVGMDGG
jgi:hypothetical protein